MKDKVFFDSNLWIYAYSKTDKSPTVIELIDQHFDNTIISSQVLSECFNVLTRKKLKNAEQAQQIIEDIATFSQVADISKHSVAYAIRIHLKYKYAYYDSLIIASALENHCVILYSEDMQHQQMIDSQLKIINPFV
ncbi:MAG: PIN domain-containing protein [Thioploca sp.]|nr:PIN domain-containing protein [Thioploca sp.]